MVGFISVKRAQKTWQGVVLLVLNLHRFSEKSSDYVYETTPSLLAQIASYLNESECISASDALSEKAGHKQWAITVDDGFDTDLELAKWLASRGLNATLFVVPEWIGKTGRVTWQQVQAIRDLGHEIGSHSYNHRDLTSIPNAHLRENLTESRRAIERHLRCDVSLLAYPWGRHNRKVQQAAREAGYQLGFGVTPLTCGSATPRFAIPRLALHQQTTTGDVARVAASRQLGRIEHAARQVVFQQRKIWVRGSNEGVRT
jgi:peptidoglycan/xylan/chitin deacetylase (PgdA/CDA1 family)